VITEHELKFYENLKNTLQKRKTAMHMIISQKNDALIKKDELNQRYITLEKLNRTNEEEIKDQYKKLLNLRQNVINLKDQKDRLLLRLDEQRKKYKRRVVMLKKEQL